jgi:hypothetical protein
MTEIIAFIAGIIACAIYHAVRCRMADRKAITEEEQPWDVY